MKLEDVKLKWTSGMACPDGIHLENIYHLKNKNGKLYFSDGNLEKEIQKDALINIFSPSNCDSWDEVEFVEVKPEKQYFDKKQSK